MTYVDFVIFSYFFINHKSQHNITSFICLLRAISNCGAIVILLTYQHISLPRNSDFHILIWHQLSISNFQCLLSSSSSTSSKLSTIFESVCFGHYMLILLLILNMLQARAGLDYESSYGKVRPNDTILKLQRTTPYYKRNRAHICSFYIRGECTRGAECPYRHEMPVTGELSQQNIKDRYYGYVH